MAHPIREKAAYGFPPNCILERPKMAHLLAAITTAGTVLEFEWSHLYALLLGLRHSKPEWVETPYGHTMSAPFDDVALQIFDVVQAAELRKQLTQQLAASQLDGYPELIRGLRDEVLVAIRDAAKARNLIVHGLWGTSDDYPDDLILIPKGLDWKNCLVYEESDFKQSLTTIHRAIDVVQEFVDKLLGVFNADLSLHFRHALTTRRSQFRAVFFCILFCGGGRNRTFCDVELTVNARPHPHRQTRLSGFVGMKPRQLLNGRSNR